MTSRGSLATTFFVESPFSAVSIFHDLRVPVKPLLTDVCRLQGYFLTRYCPPCDINWSRRGVYNQSQEQFVWREPQEREDTSVEIPDSFIQGSRPNFRLGHHAVFILAQVRGAQPLQPSEDDLVHPPPTPLIQGEYAGAM
jgi:hypothetical protein